jgi:hypothetical protein
MRPIRAILSRTVLALLLATLGPAVPSAAAQDGLAATLAPGAAPAALSPRQARGDRERLWSLGCVADEARTTPRSCVFGLRSSAFTLALVGDSHASHLFAAFEKLAQARGWRLVVFTKVECPFLDIRIEDPYLGREYRECAAWNANVLAKLRSIRPDLTVTIADRWIHPTSAAKDSPEATGAAIGRLVARVPGRRAVLVDTPYSFDDVPGCLERHRSEPDACRIPRSEVMSGGVRTRERVAAAVAGARVLDLTSVICGGFPCRVVKDGVVMFRDKHHLTNTYAATLWTALGSAIDRAFG